MTRTIGIDLSEWDLRPLDWRQASKKLSFAFIKISQGTNPDPLFRAQWDAASGWVLRGLYHFMDAIADPKLSADKTIELASQVEKGELPPVLDIERGSASTALARARVWLERYEDRTGIKPIVYSGPSFLNFIGAASATWLRSYTEWLAQYYYDNMSEPERAERLGRIFRGEIVPPYPKNTPPWSLPADFWQWTSRAKPELIPGYYMGLGHKLAVDLNYYNGTERDLFTRYGMPPKRLGNGDTMNYKFAITPKGSIGSKVRKDHYVIESPVTNQVGSLSFGRSAFGDEVWTAPADGTNYKAGDRWLRVKMVDGALYDGWIAEIHNGTQYATITPITIEEPPIEEPPAEAARVSIDIEINPFSAGEDITGTVDIGSEGHLSQRVSLRLPPV